MNEFLATRNLDAVYIATPSDSHRILTEKCAVADKPFLCEKPMATNYADAAVISQTRYFRQWKRRKLVNYN